MFDTKELNMDHIDQIKEVWNNSGVVSGTERTETLNDAFLQSLEHYLSNKTSSRMVGSFKNNQLCAFLSMDKIYGWPYYSQGWLTVRKSKFFNPLKNGASDCFRYMEQIGEKNQWYRYFIHQADDKWQDWRKYHDPENRYSVFIEEKIPSNCLPTNAAFLPMMGYQTWPIPTIVKSLTLKTEFILLQKHPIL